MKARFLASAAVAAAVILGTSACGLVAPQATTLEYDASDGVSATVGTIKILDAVVVSDDGVDGNLVFTAVNTGSAHMLQVQYESGSGTETIDVMVDENATVGFGGDTTDAVLLPDIDSIPGSLLDIYFQYGQESGVEARVPVLDGEQKQYSTFVPKEASEEAAAE
ncbi:hypothetical protein GCM10027416_09210 [Okibacterium endophyticum]